MLWYSKTLRDPNLVKSMTLDEIKDRVALVRYWNREPINNITIVLYSLCSFVVTVVLTENVFCCFGFFWSITISVINSKFFDCWIFLGI